MKYILSALLILSLSACAMPPRIPPPSTLELRQLQTREFHTRDTKLVMRAVLEVLQDEGFITKNAVTDLGFITASKEVDVADANQELIARILGGKDASWDKNAIIEANANVAPRGSTTRVRITFQRKILNNRGEPTQIVQINDPRFYQDFFIKMDKGVFLEGEGI